MFASRPLTPQNNTPVALKEPVLLTAVSASLMLLIHELKKFQKMTTLDKSLTFSGRKPPLFKGQQGSALIISLAILTILTLGASVAMQRSSLQVRMTNNLQFKQQMFNAAYSDIQTMMANLEADLKTASTTLGALISDDKQTVSAGGTSGTDSMDIFAETGWTSPDYSYLQAVHTITNTVRVGQQTQGKKYSIKESAGNSVGTQKPYYFVSQVVASNSGGNITSNQEQGFVFMGASPE
jgi:Tfp pilus assembly protein PilX